ncbi:hypothetical protein RJ639_003454 [Escallonia herrerae]|uniref:Rab-GAP TBC domain-containing protein n=1 Tax=Escallonia herrerae TaxID=1293975 RepID=A0AA89B1D5_9ASTE|nr:hypothetical protein RJ639_003454 [Escallonia herrerae]
MVVRRLGSGRGVTRNKATDGVTVISLLLLLWMFSDGGGIIFVEGGGSGRSNGGGGFWIGGGSPSNVGIAIALTAMAGLALAATLVYSHRFRFENVSYCFSAVYLFNYACVTSFVLLWFLLVENYSLVVLLSRGGLKSPWSRRRRKHALLPKQWKILFDTDGRLLDGGVKFLKKVRSGGVDPSLRAEVWPFLLGVLCQAGQRFCGCVRQCEGDGMALFYDLGSSKEERESIRTQKRKEYANLRRQCQQIVKPTERSFNMKGTFVNSNEDSGDFSQVLDSPGVDDVSAPLFPEKGSPVGQNSDNLVHGAASQTSTPLGERSLSGITCGIVSEADTDSSDSESSEDAEELQLFLTPERIQGDVDESAEDPTLDEHIKKSTISEAENRSKSQMAEDFSTWQRIIRLDAVRANDEWTVYSPSQVVVSTMKARRLAESVGLLDYDHLEPCRIFHAARLVAILEAYALYDSEIGYCQGMSDLLSPIISVMEKDHEAFWCFVGFMKKARHNFRLDEVGIRRQLNMVSKIIKGKDSNLYRHLEKLQAEDCFFVYRMVVVLFRREFNFEQTLCLWEVMWADQAAIRAGIAKSAWGRMRLRAPPTDDLLLYAVAACVLQRRKLIIEKYSSMDEIFRECNSMAGHLDVWKLLDDAHDLVVNLHDKI